jgi:hypothetical protein
VWFGLLIVLPTTAIVWLVVRLFGKRLDFGALHQRIYALIIGAWLLAIFSWFAGAALLQIWRHLCVLLILVPVSVAVSTIDARETRTRLRQRDARRDGAAPER